MNQTSAPGAGISTTSLGNGAPAYYEVGEPTGDYAGKTPRGVMLVIHGGGWSSVGPGDVAVARPEAERWRARGWRTLNVTYRACSQSFGDVQWFYDRARTLWGATLPYCATGGSAGGHLALLLWVVGERDGIVPLGQGTLLRDKMLANDPNAYAEV